MPLYLDHHKNVEGLTEQAVHDAHMKDLEAQDKHGTGSTRRQARSFASSKLRVRKRRTQFTLRPVV